MQEEEIIKNDWRHFDLVANGQDSRHHHALGVAVAVLAGPSLEVPGGGRRRRCGRGRERRGQCLGQGSRVAHDPGVGRICHHGFVHGIKVRDPFYLKKKFQLVCFVMLFSFHEAMNTPQRGSNNLKMMS